MITKALLVGPPHADIANLGDLLLQCGCLVGNVDVSAIFNGLSWLENGDERSGSGDGTQLPPQLPPGLVIQTPPQLEEHGQGSPGNSTVFIYICSDTTADGNLLDADGRECASLAGLRLRCLKLQCPNVVAVLDCNGASGVLKDRTSSPNKRGKGQGKGKKGMCKGKGKGKGKGKKGGGGVAAEDDAEREDCRAFLASSAAAGAPTDVDAATHGTATGVASGAAASGDVVGSSAPAIASAPVTMPRAIVGWFEAALGNGGGDGVPGGGADARATAGGGADVASGSAAALASGAASSDAVASSAPAHAARLSGVRGGLAHDFCLHVSRMCSSDHHHHHHHQPPPAIELVGGNFPLMSGSNSSDTTPATASSGERNIAAPPPPPPPPIAAAVANAKDGVIVVELTSFGRRKGKPGGLAQAWNCTTIENPSSASRKGRTGADKRLRTEVMAGVVAQQITADAVSDCMHRVAAAGGAAGTVIRVGFGCEMGKHRSVSVAITVGKLLRESLDRAASAEDGDEDRGARVEVIVTHRDIVTDSAASPSAVSAAERGGGPVQHNVPRNGGGGSSKGKRGKTRKPTGGFGGLDAKESCWINGNPKEDDVIQIV